MIIIIIVIDNKQAVANAFNDYFINIAHELMQIIVNINVNSFKIFLNNRNNNSMFLFPIIQEEFIDVVNRFKSKKSSDCNEFSMEMIKKSFLVSLKETFSINLSTQLFSLKK